MLRPTAQTIGEDLLGLIFHQALPVMVYDDGTLIIDNAIEPVNLSMVCRSWRAAVASHPSLWSYIEIDIIGKDKRARAQFLPLVRNRLERSKTSPLRICFCLELNGVGAREIIDITLAQHFRLEDVNIQVYTEDPHTEQELAFQLSPSLISLELCVYREDDQVPSKFAASLDFTSCAVSTKLRYLSIEDGVRCILPKHSYHALHFPNLTKLIICTDLTGTIDDFHIMLSACLNIESLYVDARRCVHSSSSSTSAHVSPLSDPVLLSHLTRLDIWSENRSATMQVLSWLMCPSLLEFFVSVKECQIDSTNFEDHCMTLPLLFAYHEFFARSQPPLVDLTLMYLKPPSLHSGHGRALRNILRPLRTLEVLDLRNILVDGKLFEEMTFQDGEERDMSAAVCPSLSSIDVIYNDLDTLTFSVQPKIVENMIFSRRRSPTHVLKNITLRLPGFSHTDSEES